MDSLGGVWRVERAAVARSWGPEGAWRVCGAEGDVTGKRSVMGSGTCRGGCPAGACLLLCKNGSGDRVIVPCTMDLKVCNPVYVCAIHRYCM